TACIRFWASGKSARWITGTPRPQAAARSWSRPTTDDEARIEERSSAAEIPTRLRLGGGVAATAHLPTDTANDASTAASWSLVVPRFLKRASSFQTNLGGPSNSDDGAMPRRRASVYRSSVVADRESSASALHHSG